MPSKIIDIIPNSGTTVNMTISPRGSVHSSGFSELPIPLIVIMIDTGSSEFNGYVIRVDVPFSE